MNRPLRRFARLVAVVVVALMFGVYPSPRVRAQDAPMLVYLGTYTGPKTKSKGIYVVRFDPKTGALGQPEVAAEVENPSFVTIHPSRRFLYAVGEISNFRGKKAGAVSAFSIDPATGKLTMINQESTGGDGPCWVATDATGKVALV